MRVLIIVTLIVLILAFYFRYEKFQMGEKLIPRFTSYKKQVPNNIMNRIFNFVKFYQSNDKYIKARGKNFILPGTRYMPLSGRTLFRRKFLPHPQIS